MEIGIERDLWSYLQTTEKTVVLYGMGNGADKILAACREKGIAVREFFASDGFVRGQVFHEKTVLSWSEVKARYGAQNLIVLLSFGTSREDVLENIERIAAETELYAPDVPAFGDGLFDLAFFRQHRAEFEAAYALLSDDESRRVFENTLRFKLTGNIRYLALAESDMDDAMHTLVQPETVRAAADLGAYNGDTARGLLDLAKGHLQFLYAMEPDARNFKKLSAYAESETRAKVIPICAGAWSREETLRFDASGNRNASLGENRSATLNDRPVKWREVTAMPLDSFLGGRTVDYIKYDVEGAEHEAILGSHQTIRKWRPTLLVSLYHRNEDLFDLPLLVHREFPEYHGFYLRRKRGIPAWDLNLYVTPKKIKENE